MAWYPKVALSSAILETLVAHGKKDLSVRILQLIRIQVSMIVSCPFCLDLNSFECEKSGISEEELQGLAGRIELEQINSFSIREKLAIQYAKLISQTPVIVPEEFIEKVKSEFTEREIVIIASTSAQVNYWARMIKALGVPPAGFSDRCKI